MACKIFDKKIRFGVSVNEVLAQELHKGVINKRKVYSRFEDNVQAADLVEKVSLFFFNYDVKYLLCVIPPNMHGLNL